MCFTVSLRVSCLKVYLFFYKLHIPHIFLNEEVNVNLIHGFHDGSVSGCRVRKIVLNTPMEDCVLGIILVN